MKNHKILWFFSCFRDKKPQSRKYKISVANTVANRICYFFGGGLGKFFDFCVCRVLAAFTETLAYPATAKYYLKTYEGIDIEPYSRSVDCRLVTDYQKKLPGADEIARG